MRELFDELVSDGDPAVRRLIKERRQEAVDLEFKTKADPNKATLSADDRCVLGRTLSAFSNLMGGIIVYGVNAQKDDDGVDCATEAQPIRDIERFKNEVVRAAGQLLMPQHDGIMIEHIEAADRAGAGYLVIYVERSERRPHRSEAKGDKQYYKRAGESGCHRRLRRPAKASRQSAHRAQSDFGGNPRIDRAPCWRCLRDIHVCDATLKLL